jgi:micrococcal nuclease
MLLRSLILTLLFWLLLYGTAFGQLPEGIYTVQKVVDGDTIKVFADNKVESIRLIGIDCPELARNGLPPQLFANEAKAHTQTLIIASNNRVRIAHDGTKRDRYGRTLAMVYVRSPVGEVLINSDLVNKGLAKAQLQYSYSKAAKTVLLSAENQARQNRVGLFGAVPSVIP